MSKVTPNKTTPAARLELPVLHITPQALPPHAIRYEELSTDVTSAPLQTPDPPIDSWPHLLAPRALHLRLKGNDGAGFGCQSRCTFCEARNLPGGTGDGGREPEADMPLETWAKLRDTWLPYIEGVELAGLAEPLLAKNFPAVAADVLAAGKVLYFPTNGFALNTKVTDVLGDGENVRVSISIDAGDEATFMEIGRGVKAGDWDRLKRIVKAFAKKCPKASLHSQFTAGIYNQASFPAFIDLCAELGITEVTWRMVQAHTVARENVSLRFAKDLTERTLTEGWEKAQAAGITLNAERRPYAEEDGLENSLTEPDAHSETAVALRYASFAPFNVVVCSGHTTTYSSNGTCTTIIGAQSTTSFSGGGWTITSPSSGLYENGGLATVFYHADTTICGASTCVLTTSTVQCTSGTTQGISAPTPTGPFTTTMTNGACPSGWTGMAEDGDVKIVRSVIVPRAAAARINPDAAFQPESVGQESVDPGSVAEEALLTRPVRHADAAVIAWADGRLSSCFSKHWIGSADMTWEEVILNPRYQAFLQRRDGADGGVLAEEWCTRCPKTF